MSHIGKLRKIYIFSKVWTIFWLPYKIKYSPLSLWLLTSSLYSYQSSIQFYCLKTFFFYCLDIIVSLLLWIEMLFVRCCFTWLIFHRDVASDPEPQWSSRGAGHCQWFILCERLSKSSATCHSLSDEIK